MADQTGQIIREFGNTLLIEYKAAIPSASGETADAINIEHRENGWTIRGPAYLKQLQDGRGPTSPNARKGSPTLQEKMLDYIRALSIRPREPNMTDIALSWAFSKSIHKNGFRGKGDLFGGIITNTRVQSLTKTLLKEKTTVIKSDLIAKFDFA